MPDMPLPTQEERGIDQSAECECEFDQYDGWRHNRELALQAPMFSLRGFVLESPLHPRGQALLRVSVARLTHRRAGSVIQW